MYVVTRQLAGEEKKTIKAKNHKELSEIDIESKTGTTNAPLTMCDENTFKKLNFLLGNDFSVVRFDGN